MVVLAQVASTPPIQCHSGIRSTMRKLKKGYVDQTHLVQDLIQKEKPRGKDGYKEIENKVIAEIVQRLQDMAHQKIQANYKVSSQQGNTSYGGRSTEGN